MFSIVLDDIRFDLIISSLYTIDNEKDNDDNQWIEQLKTILIAKDKQWLRNYYLTHVYTDELLCTIDEHNEEKLLIVEPMKANLEQLSPIKDERIK